MTGEAGLNKDERGRAQTSDEMRKRWADIRRIYYSVISERFVSFYVVPCTVHRVICSPGSLAALKLGHWSRN